MASEKAGIYLNSKFFLNKDDISLFSPGAVVTRSDEEGGYAFLVDWKDLKVAISVRDEWSDKSTQISGMGNYVSQFNLESAVADKLLQKISKTEDVLGCVIEPGFDDQNRVANLLLQIATKYSGYVFTYQSFYGEDGSKLVGSEESPDHIM